MLILLVKTPPRALLSHSFFHTTLGGDNTNKGYSKRSAKSCHLEILSLAVNTHLVGENTNKGYSEKSCHLANLQSCSGRFP